MRTHKSNRVIITAQEIAQDIRIGEQFGSHQALSLSQLLRS
jgi:hypothetical protein